MGLIKAASLGGHRYFASFIDNLSRHRWIYLMRQRCEVLDMLVKWKEIMEKQTGSKIKELQIGNIEDTRTNSYNLVRTLVLVLTSQMDYMS